ncbi:SOS response-associated peptidase [Pseudidiomarina terrestris]|uniref:SOS response-associated peptidase n=1 Tax=Pseudidiomarina terrestris TaxID=2820060 RepID=UPI002652DD79|nr:SOS response-associated peptidase [Pseudidiomarina sp. 1ASP75-5]MDN7135978.1 SOS response-associated peptidase [Pseudidiomarina sp. 1ASP75-5]
MCGRLDINDHQLTRFVSEQLGLNFTTQTNHDLRPTQQVEIVAYEQELQQLSSSWGIQPQWAKRPLINAQAETAATKPTFKAAFKLHRCVVPCSGWYEWKAEEGQSKKTKYLFTHPDEQPFYMAGLYFPMTDGENRLVTLTTAPTPQCLEYHHRMPLLVRPDEVTFWLTSNAEALDPLLHAPQDIPLSIHKS